MARFAWVAGSACALTLGTALFSATLAGAAVGKPTGDSCTAKATGTSYALTLTIPSAAQPQFGFAFGVPGASVTNAIVAGVDGGTFSTQNLPAKATGLWITPTALMPGSVVALLTTTHAGTGSVTVTPASASTPTYFSPIICAVTHLAPPSSAFTVSPGARYFAPTHSWHLGVKVSGPGVLSAVEPEPTVGTAGSAQVTATPIVQAKRIALKSPGQATLTLRLTPRGERKLAAANTLHVKLNVTFDPKNGEPTSKLVTLTLKKS